MRVVDAKGNSAHVVAERVARVVQRGGTVIFPTDTVYGIGCDPVSATAVARVFSVKNRPADRPLSLHLASVEEMLEYAPDNEFARALAAAFMPGPLTTIVRRPAYVDAAVTGGRGRSGSGCPNTRSAA